MIITIATICFQAEKCIAKTIQSVMNQRNCRFEYLVEDGMSTDTTVDKVKKALTQNENVDISYFIYSEQDYGVYDAMNRAVKRAHGDWVLFLNAGDVFFSDHVLESIQGILDKTEADVVYGNAVMRDVSGDSLFEADLSLVTRRMPFCHQAVFTRHSLLEKMPFDLNYKIAGDYDFFTRAYVAGNNFMKVDQIIAIYTMDGISSTKYIAKLYEQEKIYYQRGFVHRKYGVRFVIKYVEALGKTLVLKCVPQKAQHGIRRFYAKYVKKYTIMEKV